MIITKTWLKSLEPCEDGYDWWVAKYGEEVELSTFVEACTEEWGYVRWIAVRCLTHRSQVKFAVWCAREMVHLCTVETPLKAIEAAEKWLGDPTAEHANAAYAAANATYAAADAAAYAAYAAAYADNAAAAAAYAAAYADNAAYAAAYADNAAAYAASNAQVGIAVQRHAASDASIRPTP
jgi:hypothetical protein